MVAAGATKVCTCNYAMVSAFVKDDTTMTKTKTNDAVVEYTIYTDGAYSNLHQEGAFVFIMLKGDEEIMRMGGKIKNEDCNRAEIKAIIAGVSKLPADAKHVKVISDSMTALKTLARRIPNVKNMDLLAIWDRVLRQMPNVQIDLLFVKGHSGEKYNEICDDLCIQLLGYEPNRPTNNNN